MQRISRFSRFVVPSLVLGASLTACGSATSSQSVDSNPSSPSSPMQSSLSASSDALTGVDSAEAGSQVAPDISGNPAALSANNACVAVMTNPSPLDPNNLPLQYSIQWTYTDCRRGVAGGMVSGVRNLQVSRDPNSHTRTLDGNSQIERDYIVGAHLASNANSQVVSVGLRSSGSVTRTVQSAGEHVFTSDANKTKFDHAYTTNLQVADAYAPASQGSSEYVLSQRVINGTVNLDHKLADATTVTTFNAITYQPASCGYPMSGSLEVKTTLKNGTVNDDTYTWSSPCGTLTKSTGQTVQLQEAP